MQQSVKDVSCHVSPFIHMELLAISFHHDSDDSEKVPWEYITRAEDHAPPPH